MKELYIISALSNNIEAMKIILKFNKNIDPNSKDADGITALHHAAANSYKEIVKFIALECRKNPNVSSAEADEIYGDSYTPLYSAIKQCNKIVPGYIVDEKSYPLVAQAQKDSREIADILLNAGAETDVSYDGVHILQFAIQNDCKTFIEKVIEEDRIDLSAKFLHEEATPCALAHEIGHYEIRDMMAQAIDRKNNAATKIQKITRGYLARNKDRGPTL